MLTQTSTHEQITHKIVNAIQRGQIPPWRRPISGLENDGFPTHPATLKPYKGVNVLLMNMAAMAKVSLEILGIGKPNLSRWSRMTRAKVEHKAVRRKSDGKILGVVGPRYRVLQNEGRLLQWFQPFL